MTIIEEIKKVIDELPHEQACILKSWLNDFEALCWDKHLAKLPKANKPKSMTLRELRTWGYLPN